jgi:hypothetical protein
MTIEEFCNNWKNPIEMERFIRSGVPCYQCWGFATTDSNLRPLTTNQALTLLPDYCPGKMLTKLRVTTRYGSPNIVFETLDTEDLY